ncbi:Enoyl-[acyl-carrier-protein] reductase [NADH] chloroplastic [Zea mays]|uniref:Enoyl-[acyl-carrier-protein] reductase [NADH] chloroplastic n=1 Tax=Zea mays TaxID=4577 RepID=A0A1D6KBL3_MAIZE|nr:Enoyl-[acyl-carrier-protein] reductase [NADH] chloroplastic [Zea mays]ONM00711.1 Enoyl-[acyl-carrier-protein] reductase [NADH] chloroplastic [Zea mays]
MEYAPSSLAFVVHRLSVSHLPQKPSRLGSEARVTIVDVRDEERGYDSHIVKSNKRCAGASNWTVKDIVESVRNEFGSIDILVHSLANGPEMGTNKNDNFEAKQPQMWRQQFIVRSDSQWLDDLALEAKGSGGPFTLKKL